MDLIRPFRRNDIPEVVELFRWAFQRNGNHDHRSSAELGTYFARVFFETPWFDEELPSYVHQNSDGGIDGFVGIQPKRFRFRGRPLRAAAPTKLMAGPGATPLVATRLLRRVLAGPQDLLVSDIATDDGRRIFQALGAVTVTLYSMKWQRPVRPARHALSWLRARGVPGLITWGLQPVARAADAMFAPRRGASSHRDHSIEDLPLDVLATQLPELVPRALQPDYDAQWLDWLLWFVQHNESTRVLRRRLVRDRGQRPVGWFLYFLEPGAEAEVLQVAARTDARGAVLDALLEDAWSAGAAMVTGRLEPGLVSEMSARNCYFRQADFWTVVHAKDPEILAAIQGGNAFLSRLEGEW